MAITETMKSLVGFITSGFDKEEDMFGEIGEQLESDYMTENNLALATNPTYEKKEKPNLKVVTPHPAYKGYEVAVVEPRAFGECAQIISRLKENKTIILNLHLLDKEQSQRTIDVICGAAEALNANPQQVGDTVFVFTPANVTLSVENKKESGNIREALWNQP